MVILQRPCILTCLLSIAQNISNCLVESKQYTGNCMFNALKPSNNGDFLAQRCRLRACTGLMKCYEYSERTCFRNMRRSSWKSLEGKPLGVLVRGGTALLQPRSQKTMLETLRIQILKTCYLFLIYIPKMLKQCPLQHDIFPI